MYAPNMIMTTFGLSLVFFDPLSTSMPGFDVSHLESIGKAKCACSEILKRVVGRGVGSQIFTLHIICHSATRLVSILPAHKSCLAALIPAAPSMSDQQALLFKMKEFCDCQIPYESEEHSAIVEFVPTGSEDSAQSPLPATPQYRTISTQTTDMQTMSDGGFIRVPPHVLKLRMNKQKKTKVKTVNSTIKAALLPPLKGNQFQAGHIYIMAQGVKSGFVKIGYSHDNPVIREKQLRACSANLRLVSYTRVAIPKGRKVESLVHT